MSDDMLSGSSGNPGWSAGGGLEAVGAHIREQAAAFGESSKVPGYLAGVYHDGEQAVVAHGMANVVTGAPMREDTGFLFGSITKALTTTLVLQQVERGLVDLDEPVVKYVPEFQLSTPSAAEKDPENTYYQTFLTSARHGSTLVCRERKCLGVGVAP